MKKKSLIMATCVALVLVLGLVGSAAANNATYSPSPKTISGTAPFDDSYTLKITSPTSLNANIVWPRLVDVTITRTDAPPGASTFPSVTSDPTTFSYTATAQEKGFTISVVVPSGTLHGDYTYTIAGTADSTNPSGNAWGGWGFGSATLTVSVTEPTATDTTPPIITITSPTPDQKFDFCNGGTLVDIAFNATDGESAISAASASVNGTSIDPLTINGLGTNSINATGTYNATQIGSYTLTASATSEGGTSDGTVNFSVNYNLLFLPPLSLGKTSKGGSTVPIKFTARDCSGAFVHDGSVQIVVNETTSGGDEKQLEGVFGQGADYVRIDDEAGQYIINFQTASGAHNYRVDVYFNDFNGTPFLQGSKTFSVR